MTVTNFPLYWCCFSLCFFSSFFLQECIVCLYVWVGTCVHVCVYIFSFFFILLLFFLLNNLWYLVCHKIFLTPNHPSWEIVCVCACVCVLVFFHFCLYLILSRNTTHILNCHLYGKNELRQAVMVPPSS